MRSLTLLLCAAAAVLVTGIPAFGQDGGGLWGRGVLPGVGAPPPMPPGEGAFGPQPGGGGFLREQRGLDGAGPFQPGVGLGAAPWRPEGAGRRAWRGTGLQPYGPGWRHDGWRRGWGGYGVGLVYPYFDDYGDEPEEEPLPPPSDEKKPSPPKPAPAGPKTVSAPAASAAAPTTPAASGKSLRCGKGRRVSFGAGSGGFGCISP